MLLLTKRQKELWNFIHEHYEQRGRIPRLTDMSNHLKTSNRAILDILRGLEKKEYIEMPEGTYSIKLLKMGRRDFTPFLGMTLSSTGEKPLFVSTSNLNSTNFTEGEVILCSIKGWEEK